MEAALTTQPRFNPAPLVQMQMGDADLNKPVMNIRGDQVTISGVFDLRGLRLLEKRIAGLKALMAPDDDEGDSQ